MQFKRFLTDKIQRLAGQFPALVVTGARQVGKTTLLRLAFPDFNYVSLDLPSLAEAAESQPEEFLARYPQPLIVDEVQYAPGLFRYLKAQIDRDRHRMGQYILTGSQKFPLMNHVSDSLAGRAAILHLETLSLLEVGDQTDWIGVMARGMYPELWRQPELEPGDFFSSYVATYLERDVRQILQVASLRDFERFLRAAALRSGQLLNRSDLARDVGIAPKTAGEWINVLQASGQIYLLEPYFENVGKRLIKSPKLYFHDTGLLCFLLGMDSSSLHDSSLLGMIWETFVYSELRKRLTSGDSHGATIWFYRDAQGHEMDFIRSAKGKLDLLECKWTEVPDRRWILHLLQTQEQLGKSRAFKPGQLFLVCRTRESYLKEQVHVINANSL